MTSKSPDAAPPEGGIGWIIGRLLELIRDHPRAMIASIALGIIAALCSFGWQFGVFLAMRAALTSEPEPGLVWILTGTGMLLVFGRLSFVGATLVSHLVAVAVQRDLRLLIADHLARVPIGVAGEIGTDGLRRLILDDIETVEDGIAHLIPETTANFLAPTIVLAALVIADWRLGLAAVVPIVLGIVAMSLMMRGNHDIAGAYYDGSARMSRSAGELLGGLPTARLFNDADRALVRFREAVDSYLAVIERWVTRVLRASAVLQVFFSSSLVFVLPLGLLLLATGNLSLETLLLFIVFLPGLGTILSRVSNFTQRIAQQREVLLRLDALLHKDPLPEPAEPITPPTDRTIRFEGVSFSYGSRRVLDGIELTLVPGTVTALVGPSGAGKTTLAQLLLRFFDPDEGRVTIGGVALRDLRSTDLYALVGTVFQQTWLFAGSVAENLRLGRIEADENDIRHAAQAARAHDFILADAHAYDARLETNGSNLSGGERQRLAIARTILRAPPILVLDEATAFADPLNEREIQRALSALSRDRTVLVIAHRLTTIVDADRIVVLDGGRIRETGRHDELVAAGGLYARLWACQQEAIVGVSGEGADANP